MFCVVNTVLMSGGAKPETITQKSGTNENIFIFHTNLFIYKARNVVDNNNDHLFIYSLYCVCVCAGWICLVGSGNVPDEFEVLVMRILNYATTTYLSPNHFITQMEIFFILPFNYSREHKKNIQYQMYSVSNEMEWKIIF